MATLTNKSTNTATIANQTIMAQLTSQIWSQMTHTWGQTVGTWATPITFVNKSTNTATITNKSIS